MIDKVSDFSTVIFEEFPTAKVIEMPLKLKTGWWEKKAWFEGLKNGEFSSEIITEINGEEPGSEIMRLQARISI